MKRLILFRHGKSDWDASFSNDHQRPLAPRGIAAARQMGKLLARADQPPDLVLSSTAQRASATAKLAMEAGKWGSELQFSDSLYASSPERVLSLVRQFPDDLSAVMLVGHEPTWSGLIRRFTGARVRFPTAAMAALDLPFYHWQELDFDSGELRWLLQPRFFQRFPL